MAFDLELIWNKLEYSTTILKDNPLIPLFVVSSIVGLNYSLFQIFVVIWITSQDDVDHRVLAFHNYFEIIQKTLSVEMTFIRRFKSGSVIK